MTHIPVSCTARLRKLVIYYESDKFNSIVFVHGLWGHPRKTWETEALPTSASSRPQTVRSSSDPSIGGGKTSIVGQLMRTVSKSPSIHSVATFSTTSGSRALRGSVDSSFQEIDGSSRSKSNKIYWPRDLLPADLPDARILTYGYDADVIGTLKGEAGRANSFTAHGQDLLVKLEREIMGEVRAYAQYVFDPNYLRSAHRHQLFSARIAWEA